ncbi:DEKNAAC101494 [Brettanomyces naardenensis]|uniref:DEKNAAC101494 n=1 Tax=Brettanomyces naardenensis TaxID=13370 RepID=A0A448YI34_BRENA|nr:DEKNAAC101494 [Brettanomyces naardenensis]
MGKLKKRSKLAQRREKAKQLQKDGTPHPHHKKSRGESKEMQKVAPLMAKLGSSSENDKSMAISSITLLSDNDPELRRLFLKNDLVKIILANLIHDSNDDIVVDSYGLLRNLMIDEGYSLCTHLWRSDLWTSLQSSFEKAIKSVPHLKDENVDSVRREMLVNFIDNLIGCTDSLCSEVSVDLFDGSILPKLNESGGILDFIFDLVKQNSNKRLVLSALEFLYDLATVSYKFIEEIANNDEYIKILDSANGIGKLAKTHLVGILLQVMEFRDQTRDGAKLMGQILTVLDRIYREEIDLKFTVEQLNLPYKANPTGEESKKLALAKDNFNTIDLDLDLYTSVIEMVGEGYSNQPKKDPVVVFFNTQLKQFLLDLIDSDFKDDKILSCLNNLAIFNQSLGLVNDEFLQFVEKVQERISEEFTQLLSSSSLDEKGVEEINQILTFNDTFTEMQIDYSHWNVTVDQVVQLVRVSSDISSKVDSEEIDSSLLLQFNQNLIPFLAKIAKNCGDINITKDIVKFLVDEKLLKYLESYGNFKNAEILHKKLGFLIEEALDLVVNGIFEIFDDDYDYNRPIFHDGGLLQVLKDHSEELRGVFKNIDKNVNPELRRRSLETIQNLQEFIKYKDGELS